MLPSRPRRVPVVWSIGYCVTCHNERLGTADLRLDRIDVDHPGVNADVWEKVVRKVHTGTMPPPNMPQPSQDERRALLTWLETSLDAAAKPNPGRTETLRRLNRTEYRNAVRDLYKPVGKGTSPLLLAVQNGHFELAIALVDAGADPNDQRTGFTALHTLTWVRKPDSSDVSEPPPLGSGRITSLQFVREIVKRGVDVNLRLGKGSSPPIVRTFR